MRLHLILFCVLGACAPDGPAVKSSASALSDCVPWVDGEKLNYQLGRGESFCLELELERPGLVSASTAAGSICRGAVALVVYDADDARIASVSDGDCAELTERFERGTYKVAVVNVSSAAVEGLFQGFRALVPAPKGGCLGGTPIFESGFHISDRSPLDLRYETDVAIRIGFDGLGDAAGQDEYTFRIERCEVDGWQLYDEGTYTFAVGHDDWKWFDLESGVYRIHGFGDYTPVGHTYFVRLGAPYCGDGFHDWRNHTSIETSEHCDHGGMPDETCDLDCRSPIAGFLVDGTDLQGGTRQGAYARYRFDLEEETDAFFRLCGYGNGESCRVSRGELLEVYSWPDEELIPTLVGQSGILEATMDPGSYVVRLRPAGGGAFRLRVLMSPR